jgi:hypothetical protein
MKFMLEEKKGSRARPETGYSTANEISYLNSIGKHSLTAGALDKRVLISKYIIAAHQRINWGNMNKKDVLDHANKMLYNL